MQRRKKSQETAKAAQEKIRTAMDDWTKVQCTVPKFYIKSQSEIYLFFLFDRQTPKRSPTRERRAKIPKKKISF